MKLLLLFTLAAVLGCNHAAAQIFTNLYSFTQLDNGITGVNSDGAHPQSSLVLSGGTLYGTATDGGTNGTGTVFAINTDGTGFTNLHNFTALDPQFYTNNDGANPKSCLVLSSNTLYGTTSFGGSSVCGTVFAMKTDGTGFTTLHNFNVSDGGGPEASLILADNTLYGTTSGCGAYGVGTVFAINTDGTGFTNLHNFNWSDGASPEAGLILSSNTLYGTTYVGGMNGVGTVFAMKTDGTAFTNLYEFTDGNDGAYPEGDLLLSGDTLYGTVCKGGAIGAGAVFAIQTDGTGFTNLWNFDYYDGAYPAANLILSGNTLYGTASDAGNFGFGTAFAVQTDGTGFTNLYCFTGGSDGGRLYSSLILSGNTLYGTTWAGVSDKGKVFALSLGSIPLNVQASGQNQNLTWGNPAFSLQTASALSGQWTTLSNAASPYTVGATNAQSFFRLVYTNSP